MVVNVIMQEMSYEVITQQTAAEFWSLIGADCFLFFINILLITEMKFIMLF